MWSLKWLPCGPRTGFFKLVIFSSFFVSLILLETPIFIMFLYKFPFKMSKFEATIWSKFQTLENQFELLPGSFVDPELPFKISPQIQAKQKRKTPPKNDDNAKPKRFVLQKEAFSGKRRKNTSTFFGPWSVGLSV